jgi:hypothetical protein
MINRNNPETMQPMSSPGSVMPQNETPKPDDVDKADAIPWNMPGAIAGGINPSHKIDPRINKGSPRTDPYFYKNEDWQWLLTRNQDDVITIQAKLQKAFPDFKPGVVGNKFDGNTISYFKRALGRINTMSLDMSSPVRGKKLDDALTFLSQNPVIKDKQEQLTSYRLTNPDDLKAVFTRAAQETIGRTLSDNELQKLADAYNQQEKSYQQKLARGGTAVQAPQASTFGVEQVEEKFATEAKANDYTNYIGVLSRMMAGE